jgi:putative endonuclease
MRHLMYDDCTLSQKLSSSREIGNFAENLAKQYLEKQGLVCLTTQFQAPWGEIDLIMLDRDEIVFVEVRYRRSLTYGDPIETVTRGKQKRLIKTALTFSQRYDWTKDYYMRIDVVGIYGNQLKNEITWIPNAIGVE